MPATVSSMSVRIVPWQEDARARLPDGPGEDVAVERVGDRLALLLRVGQAFERRQELAARVDELDRDPEPPNVPHHALPARPRA